MTHICLHNTDDIIGGVHFRVVHQSIILVVMVMMMYWAEMGEVSSIWPLWVSWNYKWLRRNKDM